MESFAGVSMQKRRAWRFSCETLKFAVTMTSTRSHANIYVTCIVLREEIFVLTALVIRLK